MRRPFQSGITFVTIIMLMGLCQGCSLSGKAVVSKEKKTTVETSEEMKDTAEKTVIEDETAVEKENEKKEEQVIIPEKPPKILIQNIYHSEYKEPDSYDPLMSGTYALVQLSDESRSDYPALSKALRDFNTKQEDSFLKAYDGYLSDARKWYDELDDKDTFSECYLRDDIEIIRADNAYLCIRVNEEDYMGGAHGAYGSSGYNFDTVSGKELALKDIITDIASFQTIVKDKINEKYSGGETFDSLDESIPQYLTGEEDQACSWFITPDGVDIYFGIYQLGPYAYGTQIVSVTYDEHPELFIEGFRKQEGDFVEAITTGEAITTDINSDGAADKFMIEPEMDEYGWVNSLKITINDKESKLDVHGYETTPYLVHIGGNTYIYVEMLEENDYRMICAFRVNGDMVEKIDEYGGYITDKLPTPNYEAEWSYYWESAFTSPGDLYIGDVIQIFTTHTGIARAYINDAGELVKNEDYYYAIQYDGNDRIKNRKEVKADIIDKENFETISEDVSIPAGTRFSVYGTKGEDVVDLLGSDGKLYRFAIKSDDWPQTIDGVDIEELFEGIMFAG